MKTKNEKKTCSNLFRASKVFLPLLFSVWTKIELKFAMDTFSQEILNTKQTHFFSLSHTQFLSSSPDALTLFYSTLTHTLSPLTHTHILPQTHTYTHTHKYKHTQNECEQHIFPFVKSIDNIWIEFSAEEEKRKAFFLTDIVTETKVFPKLRNVLFTF